MAKTEEVPEATTEVRVQRVSVSFTEVELYLLSEFFNGSGELEDINYDPIAKKLFVAAARAGLYDEVL